MSRFQSGGLERFGKDAARCPSKSYDRGPDMHNRFQVLRHRSIIPQGSKINELYQLLDILSELAMKHLSIRLATVARQERAEV